MSRDIHFEQFTKTLERAIAKYGDLSEEDVATRQKRQVEGLVDAERRFRDSLVASSQGEWVYKQFIAHIKAVKRNILSARPYFRERQNVFMSRISPALHDGDPRALYTANINYLFVRYVMSLRTWPPNGKLSKLAREVTTRRQELVELNLPLALSRCRIFWQATRKRNGLLASSEALPGGSGLEYMDLVQIATEGLCNGIDKFCLPYTPVFRSVCIGRMVGDFIESSSSTMLRFLPHQRRAIYRANKILARHSGEIPEDKLEEINRGVEPKYRVTLDEVRQLIRASSCSSSDVPTSSSAPGDTSEATESLQDTFVGPEDYRPDVIAERNDSYKAVAVAIQGLELFDKKLLRLKGVHLWK